MGDAKSRNRIKFGVIIPTGYHTFDFPTDVSAGDQFSMMVKTAKETEALGFDSCWVFDHFYTFPTVMVRPVFESWTTLSAISQHTTKVGLGQLVTCAAYRNPAYLAKIASCLDVMSHGRLEFGIGAGWFQEEHVAFGYEYPSPAGRIRRLEEAVNIIKKMWTEDRPSFSGKYYSIKNIINSPRPIQKPHPPILIGGMGEKMTLKVVAKYADRCNVDYQTMDVARERFETLRSHCNSIGRRYEEIEKTINRGVTIGDDKAVVKRKAEEVYRLFIQNKLFPKDYSMDAFLAPRITGTPEECVEQLIRYKSLGITYFILNFVDCVELDPLRLFAKEVIPAVREA